MKRNWKNYLYIITVLFFILGFINILFAWLGFACMVLPFILLVKNQRKTWCQQYCPRASLFDLHRNLPFVRKAAPKWLTMGRMKWMILGYFAFNLFVLTMSTVMVFKGRIAAMENIRFLLAIKLPWEIPQLFSFSGIPEWSVHLSYRIYSMMFTTTTIGLLLSWLYKPRTWCSVCPINTVSDIILKK